MNRETLLLKSLKNKDFRDFFGEIEGEKLKSAPKGYSRDNKYIEYLKMKSFLISKMISDNDITGRECFDFIIKASQGHEAVE